MQDIETEVDLAALLPPVGDRLTLVIGNKNYSSWSMRAWVLMKAFAIPFDEVRILLDQPDTASAIARYTLAGKVPILCDQDLTVWDSLAICEYLAEQYPLLDIWPKATAARARARSICAEMHSGFTALRADMPMDIRARHPGAGRTAGAQADIGRICEIWEECLSLHGAHQYLFGAFSAADAYFAPVVMRFQTYTVSLAPALQAYAERVTAHPAVAQWIREAHAEREDLPGHAIPGTP